jgi:hypothetical protein
MIAKKLYPATSMAGEKLYVLSKNLGALKHLSLWRYIRLRRGHSSFQRRKVAPSILRSFFSASV